MSRKREVAISLQKQTTGTLNQYNLLLHSAKDVYSVDVTKSQFESLINHYNFRHKESSWEKASKIEIFTI